MMIDRATCIHNLYSDVVNVTKNLETNTYKAFDKDNKEITLDMNAVEAEFDNKWKEAIGQSLHYAESTNRRAAILFIKRQNSRKDYYGELERVINKYQLPITVFTINQ